MILAWLDLSITLVIIAHVVVSLLLILVILMQRPKQEGLGAAFGSGMTDAAWGARTTDVLQKGTVYLGTLFFVFSLVLAILMGKKNAIDGKNFAVDGGTQVEGGNTPAAPEGVVPAPVEKSEIDKMKEELEKAGVTVPADMPIVTPPATETPAVEEIAPAVETPAIEETAPPAEAPAPAETTPAGE